MSGGESPAAVAAKIVSKHAMKYILPLLAALIAVACGSSPSSPSSTPPLTPTRWPLAGTVRSTLGDPISGAVVTVVDGPDAGRQATTDTFGRFGIPGLSQGGFTTRASATGFQSASKGITLTSDVVVDFQLAPLPAALKAIDELTVTRRTSGGFDLRGGALNSGPGCASGVQGVTTVANKATSATLLFPWALPAAQIVPARREVPSNRKSTPPSMTALLGDWRSTWWEFDDAGVRRRVKR